MKKRLLLVAVLLPALGLWLLLGLRLRSRAQALPANIIIDASRVTGPVPDRWKALAQGGEEKGKRMLADVVPQVAALYPKYVRIDHIYDFYDVLKRSSAGQLAFNWSQLDQTVCDIYHTGAKPFFVLGYMPPALSKDGSLIDQPTDWNDWTLLVQKTIEHYSGTNTRLCGQISGFWTTDLYYEVWNEPDLDSFGHWSISGDKNYKDLYYYSAIGAQRAANVNHFLLGGPANTKLYRNWITGLIDFVEANRLRFDFISWHHYSTNPDDYLDDMNNLNLWLGATPAFARYLTLPKIVSEWGYDSDPNPISHTNIGAAHTVMAIRNFYDADYRLAFLFEIRDGIEPRWGILDHAGHPTPRYRALAFLNRLQGNRLQLDGEGSYVRGLASSDTSGITVILVNYDADNRHTEQTPLRFRNLVAGRYDLDIDYLDGHQLHTSQLVTAGNDWQYDVILPPNTVVAAHLSRQTTPTP